MNGDRGLLDDTLCSMFSNTKYNSTYLFYAHMLGLCSIKINNNLPAPVAVTFSVDHYKLYIRPESEWVTTESIDPTSLTNFSHDDLKNTNGVDMVRVIKGFDDFSLTERLAILKHEMLHIVYDHVNPKGRSAELMGFDRASNLATDCALNQHIDKTHLPKDCIVPSTLSKMLNCAKVKENESAEFYWKLIHDEMKKNSNKSGEGGEGGLKSLPGSKPMDSHSTWKDSIGDSDLQKDITKKMIERAQDETIKSRGDIPNECSQWLEMFSRKSELDWKKVLRGIVGNKLIGRRSTIMRRDRRFPDRSDLRGKTKERKFNLLVVADVSGSMSNDDVISTLGEVRHICDVTKTDVDLIQIDTVAYTPEKLSKKTKTITRKGQGGTFISPALAKAKEHNLDFQAVVVLTDGGLSSSDIEHFYKLNKRIIWLVCKTGSIMSEMQNGRMQAFKLK